MNYFKSCPRITILSFIIQLVSCSQNEPDTTPTIVIYEEPFGSCATVLVIGTTSQVFGFLEYLFQKAALKVN